VFFVLNLIIFILALVFYTCHWIVVPRRAGGTLVHEHQETPLLAAAVTAFMTLISMVSLSCASAWGHGWAVFAYVLWWISAFLSTLVSIILPFFIVRYHPASDGIGLIAQLSPTILLIPIAPLTAAAVGGVLCTTTPEHLSTRLQVPLIIYSYWMLGLGFFLSLMLDVIYLVRLISKSVLPPGAAPSAVIMIGPLGQAASALLALGTAVSHGAFADYARGPFSPQTHRRWSSPRACCFQCSGRDLLFSGEVSRL
jgi:tellurite resistance protein TehA-like permease